MSYESWIRKLFGRAIHGRRVAAATAGRGKKYRTSRFRLRIESLEDRTVPTAPSPFSHTFDGSGSQLGNGQLINTSSAFLGTSFDAGASVGHIHHNIFGSFGAEGHLDISGKAGLNVSATIDSGNVAARFNQTLNQGYDEPTMFGEVVNFAPATGTSVTYLTGGADGTGFTTTSPTVGASASLELGLHADVGARLAVFHTVGGSASFGGKVSVPLFSFNQNG